MRLLRSIVWLLLLAGSAQAATVNYIQTSVNDADDATIGAVASDQWLETAIFYSTVSAPESWSPYRFTHWSNSSYPGTPYRDAWGRSLNQISFILLEDTTATAHYLPATFDTDSDGLPDWYEIEYFGDLTHGPTDDTDSDGISLLAEYTGGTHPLYGNNRQDGGVAWIDSGTVTLAGQPRILPFQGQVDIRVGQRLRQRSDPPFQLRFFVNLFRFFHTDPYPTTAIAILTHPLLDRDCAQNAILAPDLLEGQILLFQFPHHCHFKRFAIPNSMVLS